MADNDIEIKVRVDSQGAISVLDKLGNEIKKVDKTSNEASRGFGGFERAIISLNQGLDLAGRAFNILSGVAQSAIDALDRGAAVGDLEEAFASLTDKAGSTADVFLNQLNEATARTISNFDLMKKSNELLQAGLKPDAIISLSKAARVFSEQDGSDMQQTIDAISNSLLRGDDRFLKSKGIIIDNEKAYRDYADSVGRSVKEINEAGKAEAIRQAVLRETAKVAEGASKIQEDAGDRIKNIQKEVRDKFDEVFQKIAGNEGVLKALERLATLLQKNLPAAAQYTIEKVEKLVKLLEDLPQKVGDYGNSLKEQISRPTTAIEKLEKDVLSLGRSLGLIPKSWRPAIDAFIDGKRATVAQSESLDDLVVFLNKTSGGIGVMSTAVDKDTKGKKENAKTTKDAADANKNFGNSTQDAAKQMGELTLSMDNFLEGYGDYKRKMASGMTRTEWLDQLFGTPDSGKNGDFTQSLLDTLSNSIQEVVEAISSGSFGKGQAGKLGGAFGSLLGSSKDATDWVSGLLGVDSKFASAGLGLVGSLIGDSLGKAVFSGVARVFGAGRDKQTEARKAADKYFADLFDADRLSVIVDGELKQIKDLVFGNDTNMFETGTFDDAFQSLPDAARQAFTGVGSAFEELIGGLDEQSGQLAAVLVNNIGGSLNNLQLFVQATGKSFEDLNKTIVEAFLDGKISALEAQSALLGIQQIAQKGIPDGIGFTVQAMENLFAAGTKGGRAVVDALGDIGAEALELSIKDLPTLQANLAASGKFTADQITKVFAALQANGIDSVEKLSNATAEQLIPVLSQLQAEGVLTEANKTAADLVTTIEKLPASKDIEINLRVNASQSDRNLLNQVSSGKLGGSGEGTAPLR